MAGAYLFGWDATNKVWVKCLVNAEGKLIIDPSEIFENTPTDDEHGKAPDSDWAYDHDAKADAHHAKYTDAEAQGAINADTDHGSTAPHNYFSGSHDDLINVSEADHHAKYTDAEVQSLIDSHAAISDSHHTKYTDVEAQGAIDADADHGSAAPHNYFSGSHSDLSDVIADQHHAKYTDVEAKAAIEAGNVDGVQFANYERGDYDTDGFLYWDLSAGLYIRSSNAPYWGSGGRLIWSGANVHVGEGISISYGGEDEPTISTTGAAGSVPSGSKMLFKQGSAPTGWTFVSEDNDRVILNTSTEADGGNTGGGWTISGLSGSVSGHALSISELPSHNHGGGDHTHPIKISGSGGLADYYNRSNSYTQNANIGYSGTIINSNGGNGSHGHGFSWSHDGSWRPAYVKVITCQKD